MIKEGLKNKSISDSPVRKQPLSRVHNASAITENQLLGINRVVNLKIIIEGKIIKHYHHFSLSQSAVNHHSFVLKLPFDALNGAENHELSKAQEFLGKRLTVVFTYKGVSDTPERNFVGIVLEVGFEQEQGNLGGIVLKGFSPTVLLDAAPHTQSFGGAQPVNLSTIVHSVTGQGLGSSKFDVRVDPEFVKEITYSSQYNETHYNYLARMAEAYGEQFFYDGEVLHFGKLPPQEKPLELSYGSNVSDINIAMKAQHVNPTFYGYNSSKNEKLTSGQSSISHASDMAKRAYAISQSTFKTPSLRVAPIKASTYKDVDASQKGTAGSKAAEVFVTTGKVSLPFLYPGCVADLKMRQKDSSKTTYFTKLMVTEVTHNVDAKGNYFGSFEAIAADSGFMPRPKFDNPLAEAQVAKVVSNTDPDNQGRVQVQFDWQNSETTEFIRVMTPDAGGSDKVSKNRGFMAIPEVGDQVMVNFQHNHPDRPFVMGGMFHGSVGGGGGEGNKTKSLSSRSGNKLELDDNDGSVYLTDQGGANMKFDGAGNASLNANTDQNTTVGQNKNTNVGQNQSTTVGQNYSVSAGSMSVISAGGKEGGGANSILKMDNAGNITIECDTNITIKVGGNSITISKDGIITTVGEGNIKSIATAGTVEIKSTSDSATFSGTTDTNVGGGNTTFITGSEVEINQS